MSSHLTSAPFWRGAIERAIRAAAWAFLATLGVPAVDEAVTGHQGFDVRNVGWASALAYAAGAAVLSVVFSIIAGKVSGPPGSASMVYDRPVTPRQPLR